MDPCKLDRGVRPRREHEIYLLTCPNNHEVEVPVAMLAPVCPRCATPLEIRWAEAAAQ
jgi:hypothetical protein